MNLDDPVQIADRDPSGVVYHISTLADSCSGASALGTAAGAQIGLPNAVAIVSDPPFLAEILAALTSPIADIPVSVYGKNARGGDIRLLLTIDMTGCSRLVREAEAASSPLSDVVLNIRSTMSESGQVSDSETSLFVNLPDAKAWSGGISSIFAGLAALASNGVAPGAAAEIASSVALMRRQSRAYAVPVPYDANPAKQLALLLGGRLPYLVGSNALCESIARYWRGRFSRLAKVMAVSAGHADTANEIVGWRNAIRQSDRWSVVAIRERNEPPEESASFDLMLDAISDDIPLHEVFADGETSVERVLAGMYYGEYVAGYLALMWNEDPGGE